MSLHQFLGIEIGVPDPDALSAFCAEVGLVGDGASWGSADMPGQIRISETPYRQLRAIRVGCESEQDLDTARKRLADLGLSAQPGTGRLSCREPLSGTDVILEPTEHVPLTRPGLRQWNRPGERERANLRAEVVASDDPRPPRRLGHVVVGSPDPVATSKFFSEGIGFRVSDVIAGIATFMRCSSDHHNLFVQPGPIPYLNHYALEFDDIDAVGMAATRYLEGRSPDHHVIGIGRHVVGSNVFWYMKDPCGNMFEFFSDMDDIPDDEAWEIGTEWPPTSFARWGPNEPPEVFFVPADLEEIAKGREAEGR